MLSFPDYKEKQIVIISSEEYRDISLRAGNILIKQEGKIINQISCAKIFCIWVVGDCTITTKVVDELLWYGISIYFLGLHLKPKFLVANQLEGNYLLRMKQYSSWDDLIQAIHIISNKISNQLALLQSIRSKSSELKEAIRKIRIILGSVREVKNEDSLRGLEWTVSKIFFKNYFEVCKWYRRAPRTKEDVPNFLLDIGYSLLYNFIEAHLQLYGFDMYKWFYHKLFFERKSLVCDIIEPFRAIVDQTLYKGYNLGQIDEKDFKFTKGQYTIGREERKKYLWLFLKAIMDCKEEIFMYTKEYYRAIMVQDMNKLPVFNI